MQVCGKVYNGPKFLSEPSEIIFKDFEVGKEMKQTITLTNVSFSFNTFKGKIFKFFIIYIVLPLSDDIIDFFHIDYKFPGKMSAGLTCNINISFKSPILQDIESQLSFAAETGPFSIPLKCYTKKLVPAINTSKLNLGNVVMGEVGKSFVTLENLGAIDSIFKVHLENASSDGSNSFQFEEVTSILTFPSSGNLSGYSKYTFPIKFHPQNPGRLQNLLVFTFESETPNKTVSPVIIKVLLEGVSSNLPIYLDRTLVDLQSCTFNKVWMFNFI